MDFNSSSNNLKVEPVAIAAGSAAAGTASGVDIVAKDIPTSYGATFTLLGEQNGVGSRSNLSMLNLFDTGVFLKSGSFDSLQLALGSQVFKADTLDAVRNLATTIAPQQAPAAPAAPSNNNNANIGLSPVAAIKTLIPAAPIPSNVIATTTPQINMQPQQQMYQPYGNNALIQPRQDNDKRIVEKRDDNSKFVDVTPFLTLPQHEAAKKLGIPSSTLAKRWKEASCNRKWPYRTVSKLDKEILTLLKNVENAKTELSPSVEATLGLLLKKRQEELKTVLVRL
eukprot:TRINITY_DN975_c0_g1_i1.p1 TRINITY_DN975_c0_g1~~TRINITY_DN975_c0_g1_i1.p1  ORF type:complete len:282 (+),score=65.08 TRINITY_DN975_c0_g1_i1:200-1045(+)